MSLNRKRLRQSIICLFLFFPLAIALPVVSLNEFGQESCNGNVCRMSIYQKPRYSLDYFGKWVNSSDVFNITRNSDDLTFHFNASKGYFNVTFEVGVIRNGGYFSMAQLKGLYPQINFEFPSSKFLSEHKFAVNITNIPRNLSHVIEFVTLTYKDHYGFNFDNFTGEEESFTASEVMSLAFFDAVSENFTVLVNDSEKRVFIGNLTEKIAQGSLFIDPMVNPYSETTDGYAYGGANAVWSTLRDAATASSVSNTATVFYPLAFKSGSNYYIYRGWLEFNTSSIPDSVSITNATLMLAGHTTSGGGGDSHIVSTTLTAMDSTDDYAIGNFGSSSAGFIPAGITTGGAYHNASLDTSVVPINLTGTTRMGVLSGFDLNNTAPVGATYDGFRSADYSGTASDPILEVYYVTVSVSVSLNAPADDFIMYSSTLDFNGTPQDDENVVNVSLFTNLSGTWAINQTNSSPFNNTLTNFQVTGIPDGVYLWNLQVCDNSTGNNCAFASANRTVKTPPDEPNVSLNAPADVFNSSAFTLDFNGTAQDDKNVVNVSLFTNLTGSWIANQTNSSPFNNVLTNFQVAGISGNRDKYLWNLQVCDNSTTTNCEFATSNRTFTTPGLATLNVKAVAIGAGSGGSTTLGPNLYFMSCTDTSAYSACSCSPSNKGECNSSGYVGVTNTSCTYTYAKACEVVGDYYAYSNFSVLDFPSGADTTTGNTSQSVACNQTAAYAGTWTFLYTSNCAAGSSNCTANNATFYNNSCDGDCAWSNSTATCAVGGGDECCEVGCTTAGGCSTVANNSKCTSVPSNSCVNSTYKREYSSPGTCGSCGANNANGSCSYSYTDDICPDSGCCTGAGSCGSCDSTAPTVTLNSPSDASFTSQSTTSFNCTAEDNLGLANLSLFTNFTGSWASNSSNTSIFNNTPTIFSVTGISDGAWLWNCLAYDNATSPNTAFAASNQTVNTDATVPASFSFTSGTEADNANKSQDYFYVNVTFTETSPDSCLLEVGGSNVSMTRSGSNCFVNRTSQSDASYSYRVFANDSAGNWGVGSSRSVILDTTVPNTIAYVSSTDSNNSFVLRNYYYVNVTFLETSPDSCLLEVGGSNVSMTRSGTNCFVNRTGQSDGEYNYVVYVNDSANNFNASLPRRITLDATIPSAVAFISPTEANDSTVTVDYYFVNVTFTETNEDLCVLNWGGVNETVAVTANSTGGYCGVNKTGLSDNTYLYRMFVNDSVGIWNGSEVRQVVVDAVADTSPTVSLNAPADNFLTSLTTFDFNGTATDDANLVNVSVFTNMTGSWVLNQTNSSPFNNTLTNFQVTGVADGVYLWNLQAWDNVSQSVFASSNRSFVVDASNPSLSFVSSTESDNAFVASDYFAVNATVSDANLGLCVVELDGSNATVSPTGGSYCVYNATSQSDAAHTYTMYANDSAGNWGGTAQRTVTVDATLPSAVAFVSPTESDNANLSQDYFYVNVTFAESNPDSCLLEVGGSNVSMNRSGTNCYLNRTSQSDGDYSYKVYANDSAGNWGVSGSRSVTLDTTVPASFSFISPTESDGGYVSRDYFYVNVTFAESNPDSCLLDVGGSNVSMTRSGTNCFVNRTSQSDGNYSYAVYANDSAGNFGASGARTIILDTSASFSFSFVSSTDANNANVSRDYFYVNVTFTGENPESCLFESNSSNVSMTRSASLCYVNRTGLSEGSYSYKVYANDSAGNWAASGNRTVNLDTTNPSYSNSSKSVSTGGNYSSVQAYQFNVTWSDDSQVSEAILEFNGTNYTASSDGSTYYYEFSSLGAANYSYRWYANDSSGNWNASSQENYSIVTVSAPLSLYLNGSQEDLSVTSGQTTNASANSSVVNVTLYRNGAAVSNPDIEVLSVGTWNYTASFGGNENYSSNAVTLIVTVSSPPQIGEGGTEVSSSSVSSGGTANLPSVPSPFESITSSEEDKGIAVRISSPEIVTLAPTPIVKVVVEEPARVLETVVDDEKVSITTKRKITVVESSPPASVAAGESPAVVGSTGTTTSTVSVVVSNKGAYIDRVLVREKLPLIVPFRGSDPSDYAEIEWNPKPVRIEEGSAVAVWEVSDLKTGESVQFNYTVNREVAERELKTLGSTRVSVAKAPLVLPGGVTVAPFVREAFVDLVEVEPAVSLDYRTLFATLVLASAALAVLSTLMRKKKMHAVFAFLTDYKREGKKKLKKTKKRLKHKRKRRKRKA